MALLVTLFTVVMFLGIVVGVVFFVDPVEFLHNWRTFKEELNKGKEDKSE